MASYCSRWQADEHNLLLSLNAEKVDAFRFIESELVQCWSADQLLDDVNEVFRTNPSAENVHLINMKVASVYIRLFFYLTACVSVFGRASPSWRAPSPPPASSCVCVSMS